MKRFASTLSVLAIKPKPQKQEPILLNKAIELLKNGKKRNFDETVELAFRLGVDPRKPNQSVRGVINLPNGTGKQVKIAVFARGDKAEEAKKAGATIVGAEDLVKQIQDGQLNFDRCIATPDMMSIIGRVARILGPRGLMPNPKLGTVTMDIARTIKEVNSGQAEFRAGKNGMVHAGVGKLSFSQEELIENIRTFMVALGDAKPEGAKGKYFKQVHISTTMGKGYDLQLAYMDPSSIKFMNFDI